jgi:hypothetical protein
LLAGVGLGDVQVVDVDPAAGGVGGVQGVLHVDVGADAAQPLSLGDDVLAEGGLARGFRAVDLHDPPPRHAPDSQRDVERQRAGRDGRHLHVGGLAHAHDNSIAESFGKRGDGIF